ncbi:MAG TPA: helix-turn-helix domain-containing protein [Amnibacterium sp.]|nr:helix-turn-helix domain-containing protein [Amnibacterium sp.]
MTDEEQTGARVVSLDALRALAHPLRVQLFSALTSFGPATASALAARLGESSGATSYHLRQLERHGFVREDTTRGNGRDRWWERTPGVIELLGPELADSEAGRAAGELVEEEFQRLEQERFTAFWRARSDFEPSWRTAASTFSTNIPLSPDELAQFGREFEALVHRYRGRDGDDPARRRVDIHLRAFPVVDPTATTTATTTTPTPPGEPEEAQQ